MESLCQRPSSKRRWVASIALFGWALGVHLLPLLHTLSHEMPHEHIGRAIVYLAEGLRHHQAHAHNLHHAHGAEAPTEASESHDHGPDTPSDRDPPPDTPPFEHGVGSLTHGVDALWTSACAAGLPPPSWTQEATTEGPRLQYGFAPSVIALARGPPV